MAPPPVNENCDRISELVLADGVAVAETSLDQAIKYTGELDEGEFTEFLTDNIVHNLEPLEMPRFSNPCEENCYRT